MAAGSVVPAGKDGIAFAAEEEMAAYRSMLLIRRFEEKAGQLYALSAIAGACPLSIGQEGSIVGLTMAARPTDPVITGYRTHGAFIARGVPARRVMAELLGRDSGLSAGKGGSGTLIAPDHAVYGGHGASGLGVTIGTGLALAARTQGRDDVTICLFGDGAAARGRVLEAIAFAAQFKLPIVFAIDNNTAAPGASVALGQVPSALAARGTAFAVPGEQVDGIDVRHVRAAGRRAIARARAGEGPTVLEMLTFRYRGHGGVPAEAGRGERRLDDADPIAKSRARILVSGIASERELKALEKSVREEVQTAALGARADAAPEASALLQSVYA